MTAAPSQPTLAYRITHIANVPWILDHGLHCDASPTRDPKLRAIGNPDLIGKRRLRVIDRPPGGTFADYVPFYFGTHSRMLYNIQTGFGVPQIDQAEIVHLVTSVEALTDLGVPFLVTDRHAYVAGARFLTGPEQLGDLRWDVIRSRDFRNRADDPGRIHFREAELMVYRHLPITGIIEIGVLDEAARAAVEAQARSRRLQVAVMNRRAWYFR